MITAMERLRYWLQLAAMDTGDGYGRDVTRLAIRNAVTALADVEREAA